MSSVDFARLKMAGNTQQKKNCTKGWSCGYTCLGRDKKTCNSPLQGQVAKYADWLEQQAGGAGATPAKPQAQVNSAVSASSSVAATPAAVKAGTHGDFSDYKEGKNLKAVAQELSAALDVPLQEGEFIAKTLNSWTRSGYKKIKKTQRDGGQSPEVDAVNKFIEKAPKFEGEIYRGLAFGDAKKLDSFLSSLSGGSIALDSISSFSSSEDLALDFAAGSGGTAAGQGGGLLVRVKSNKSGASVVPFSKSDHKSEEEVIVPKGVQYKLLGSPRPQAVKPGDRKTIKRYQDDPEKFIENADVNSLGVASLVMPDAHIVRAYNAGRKRLGEGPSSLPDSEIVQRVKANSDVKTILVIDVEES